MIILRYKKLLLTLEYQFRLYNFVIMGHHLKVLQKLTKFVKVPREVPILFHCVAIRVSKLGQPLASGGSESGDI